MKTSVSHKGLYLRKSILAAIFASATVSVTALAASAVTASSNNGVGGAEVKHITFINTNDMHGDFHSHVNLRDGQLSEGGLGRVYTIIKNIRNKSQNSMYIHSGDTVMGSAQALFTKGQATVDVLNAFGIEAFAPGNWEWVYGVEHFRHLFLDNKNTAEANDPVAPWGLIAANAYYNGWNAAYNADPNKQPGTLVTPPYMIKTIDGVKVGIFGCTTNRGPQVVGPDVVSGVSFSDCRGNIKLGTATQPLNKKIKYANGTETASIAPEIPFYVNKLRNEEGVDIVILVSEGGLAENIYNAENYAGIDIIFSSDMHEETNYPVVAKSPNGGETVIIENGEDGAQVGELVLKLVKGPRNSSFVIDNWKWKEHDVTETVVEDEGIEELVHEVTKPFISQANGGTFQPGVFENPFNKTKLMLPLDTVIGRTEISLSRNNYSHHWDEMSGVMPALVEGTAHALMADAFRVMTGSQIGAIRGFRYGNGIPAGKDITYEDLYHILSIGPQIAKAQVTAQVLNNSSENTADGSMNPDVTQWAGGWLFNYSGLTYDLNPYASNVQTSIAAGRLSNLRVGRTHLFDANAGTLLDSKPGTDRYSYASYYYNTEPTRVNAIPVVAGTIQVLVRDLNDADADGRVDDFTFAAPSAVTPANAVDAVEVVAAYIKEHLGGVVTKENLPFPRAHLTESLPDTRPTLGFPTIQPVYGMNKNKYYPVVPANYTEDQYDQD